MYFLPKKVQLLLMDKYAKGKGNYWFAYISDSSTALFFLGWELTARRESPAHAALGWLAGFVLWGLSEYCFHRWVYHHFETVFRDGHDIHHEEPMAMIAMPWFMTTLAMAALWYLCAVVLRIPLFSSVLAGWLAGFIYYGLVHHGLHHWNVQTRWARRLKAYHRVHHHFPDTNYGVTMVFWDRVFGTTYRKPRGRSEAEADDADAVDSEAPADELMVL